MIVIATSRSRLSAPFGTFGRRFSFVLVDSSSQVIFIRLSYIVHDGRVFKRDGVAMATPVANIDYSSIPAASRTTD